MEQARLSRVQRLSMQLSYWLHPAVVLLASMWLASYLQRRSVGLALLDTLVIMGGLAPGLGYLAWQVRRGAVSHPHLLFKEERRIVLPLLVLGIAGAWLIYWLIDAPTAIIVGMQIGVIEGVLVVAITRYWKISLHAMTAMTCAALFIPVAPIWTLVIALVGIVTGLARIPIRHHTVGQVLGGWLYGFGMTVALIWLLTGAL